MSVAMIKGFFPKLVGMAKGFEGQGFRSEGIEATPPIHDPLDNLELVDAAFRQPIAFWKGNRISDRIQITPESLKKTINFLDARFSHQQGISFLFDRPDATWGIEYFIIKHRYYGRPLRSLFVPVNMYFLHLRFCIFFAVLDGVNEQVVQFPWAGQSGVFRQRVRNSILCTTFVQ